LERIQQLWDRAWFRHGVVPLLFFTAATLILTYPVIAQLETHAAGAPYGDQFEAVRLIWWTKEAILDGMHPAYQPLLVYPDGFFSPVEWAAPLAHLAGVPFALIFSPLAAYNLTFLAANVLTGLAGYLLCWELVKRQGAALLGGLIFLAFPTRMGHATGGHLGLITNYWLLLYAWSLVRLWRGAGWRTGVLGGLFFALAAGTYPTNLTYQLIPLTAVYGGAMAWRCRRLWRQWLRPALALSGVAAVGVAFFYAPMLAEYLSGDLRYLQETGVVRYSADLLAYVTPSPFNTTLSGLALIPGWAWDVLGDSTIEGPAYLGIAGIVLAALALWKRRAEAMSWLLVGLVAAVLALGPVLKVGDRVVEASVENGDTTRIAMPYALYGALPGVSMSRTPARLNMVTALAVSALAAFGFAVLTDRVSRLSRPVWQGGAVIVLAALVMADYAIFPAFPTTEAPIPAYFQTLAAEAARGEVRPVLDLPARDFFVGQWQLFYQTAHDQPILAGHEIRKTRANPAMLTLVNAAALPPVEDDIYSAMTVEQQAGVIRASGAKVVVVHRRFPLGQEMAAYLPGVLGPPDYEDAEVTIFEVPDGPPLEEVVYAVNGGWLAEGESPEAARWLDDEIVVSFYLPEAQEVYWEFEASSWLLVSRWLRLNLDGQGEDSFFLAVEPGAQRWRSSVYTQPDGFRQIRFWLDADQGGCTVLPGEPGCRRALIGIPRLLYADEDQRQTVDFGDTMRLVRYVGQTVENRAIRLNCLWQAVGPFRPDYTMFVHLLDASGNAVTQWDGPLGGTTMPTSQWPENGFVYQQAVLEIPADLEAGVYGLYVGLYTYPDITRLPVYSDRPHAADGLYYLQDIVIPPEEE